MKVVDINRPTKKRPKAMLAEEAPRVVSALTAHCPSCKTATRMVNPIRRQANRAVLTVGLCAECGEGTYRIGGSWTSSEEGE